MSDAYISGMTAAGTLSGDELIEVSQLSASVTIAATTISAAAADNSFNDSGSGFIAAGFTVGDRVNVTGFTTSGNNVFAGFIDSLTTGKMIISSPDGDTIADEAAGDSVIISKWTARRATAQDIADLGGGGANPTESIIIACSDETTDLTTGTGKVTFRMPYAFTLSAVRASVTTAPTGAALTVDINEGGSSILSTKITIDAGEKTSTTAVTAAVISDNALADDAEITFDIDTIGSTIAGAGLKVYLIGVRP